MLDLRKIILIRCKTDQMLNMQPQGDICRHTFMYLFIFPITAGHKSCEVHAWLPYAYIRLAKMKFKTSFLPSFPIVIREHALPAHLDKKSFHWDHFLSISGLHLHMAFLWKHKSAAAPRCNQMTQPGFYFSPPPFNSWGVLLLKCNFEIIKPQVFHNITITMRSVWWDQSCHAAGQQHTLSLVDRLGTKSLITDSTQGIMGLPMHIKHPKKSDR